LIRKTKSNYTTGMDTLFYPIDLLNYLVPLVYTTLFDGANYGYRGVLKFSFNVTKSSTNFLEFAINYLKSEIPKINIHLILV
jgi:hypothetical protein